MLLAHRIHRATVIRRVIVTSATLSIDDSPTERAAQVAMSSPRASATAGAPRDSDPYLVRWQHGRAAFVTALAPGDRFDIGGIEFETLATARLLGYTGRTVGFEIPALPVAELYPFTGQAYDQGGSPAGDEIAVAMWSPSERHSDTGTYESLDAEAPPEFADALTGRNRLIEIGGIAYRISGAVLDLSPPRVSMTLTRLG